MVLRHKETFETVIATYVNDWTFDYNESENLTYFFLGSHLLASWSGIFDRKSAEEKLYTYWFVEEELFLHIDNLYSLLKNAKSFILEDTVYTDFYLTPQLDILNKLDNVKTPLDNVLKLGNTKTSILISEAFFYKSTFDFESLSFTAPSGTVLQIKVDDFIK